MIILGLSLRKSFTMCTFTVPFSGNASEIVSKAKNAVEKQEGSFNGNSQSGSFHLSVMGNTIAGSYTVEGQQLSMFISEKPFFVPCSTIESMLKSRLG